MKNSGNIPILTDEPYLNPLQYVLGVKCPNCSGCLYENSCLDYDPAGKLGPINTKQCAQAGGIVCSDNTGTEPFTLFYLILFG